MTLVVCAVAVGLLIGVSSFPDASRTCALADEDAPGFIGPKKCKKCHFKQYKDWSKSTLASTMDSLKPGQAVEAKKAANLDVEKDYTKDATCLPCHVTGYGTETGFPALVEGKAWTEEETKRAEIHGSVTCEACHGPGSKYSPFKKENKQFKRAEIAALGAYSPVEAKHCTNCHNDKSPTFKGQEFDFEKEKKGEKVHRHQKLKYEH
jgi:hypothetical protein